MKRVCCLVMSVVMALLMTVSGLAASEEPDALDMSSLVWEKRTSGELGDFYALENVVYVEKPVDAAYQCMNIYVPAAYFENGECCGFTAETAPVMVVCNVGGYCGTTPNTIRGDEAEASEAEGTGNASGEASTTTGLADLMGGSSAASGSLAHGYVVVIPGCRGRDTLNADGTYNGKGAAGLVDLKAAIRWLRHNAETIPGDMEKIIACGHSAGGALSLLLGITGNVADYEPYLREIGAADERDDIFMATPTSPITDLDHADMAFEWMLPALDSFTDMEKELSQALANAYCGFIEELGLADDITGETLVLKEDYSGSYADFVLRWLSASATDYLSGKDADEVDGYLEGKEAWLKWDEKTGQAEVTDIYAFGEYVGRTAAIPQFDSFGDGSTANWTFGSETQDGAHFTDTVRELLLELGYEEETAEYDAVTDLVAEQVRLLSPYTFLGEGDTAPYIRIRMGTKDFFAPGVVSLNIAAALMAETDSAVDYAMLWDEGHNGDIGTDVWFAYIEGIVR